MSHRVALTLLSLGALTLSACGAPPAAPTRTPRTTAPAAAPALPSASAVEPAIVTLPPGKSPVVAIRLLFRAGATDDPAEHLGITSLAATLMAEGGTQSLTNVALKEKLYPWAASISVQVDADATVFSATVHKDHVSAFVPVLTEVLTQPRWAIEEFERLRRDAIDDLEKRLRTSDDEALGKAALANLLYGEHPYARYDRGSVAGLKSLTVDAVKAHAARVFTKARLTIGVSGGWPADLPMSLQDSLAALPDGAPQPALPSVPAASPTRVLIVEKDAPAVAMSLGATVPFDRRDPDFFALMVGLSAFGEHRQFHGRLMQRMREERGLNYGDYAYGEHFVQAGWSTFPEVNVPRRAQYFSIWVRPVQPSDARFALRLALHEYDKLLKDGLTPAEVERAGRFLAGYTRLWEKNAQRRLGIGLDDAWYGTPDRLTRFRSALPTLTAEAVNAALRKHLPPVQGLRIALVSKDAAALRDALVESAPSPKTYNSEKPKALVDEDAVVSTRPFGLTAEQIRIVPVGSMF